MERFEQWRRSAGLSLEQAARLWAEGIRSPDSLLARLGDQAGRAALHLRTGCNERQLTALMGAAPGKSGEE